MSKTFHTFHVINFVLSLGGDNNQSSTRRQKYVFFLFETNQSTICNLEFTNSINIDNEKCVDVYIMQIKSIGKLYFTT
jgi:hypothetical protein